VALSCHRRDGPRRHLRFSHPLHYPNVIVSWSPPAGMLGWLCLTCGMRVWQNGSVTQEAVPHHD
jgi:hypothetical protein